MGYLEVGGAGEGIGVRARRRLRAEHGLERAQQLRGAARKVHEVDGCQLALVVAQVAAHVEKLLAGEQLVD